MAGDKLFRSAISGYNKADVMKYIESMDIQYTQSKEELEGEIRSQKDQLEQIPALLEIKDKYTVLCDECESLKAEKESLNLAISAQGDKLSLLENELEQTRTQSENEKNELMLKNSSLKVQADELNEKAKALSEKAESQADRIAELEQENAKLSGLLEAASKSEQSEKEKNALLEEKLSNGDGETVFDTEEIESQVSEILEQARAEAQTVISRAKQEASKIISDANEKAKDNAEKVRAQSDELLNENMKKVKYLYKRKGELAEIFKDHKSKVDSFFSSLSDSLKGDDK